MADHPPSRKWPRKWVFPMTKLERSLLIVQPKRSSGMILRMPRSQPHLAAPPPRSFAPTSILNNGRSLKAASELAPD